MNRGETYDTTDIGTSAFLVTKGHKMTTSTLPISPNGGAMKLVFRFVRDEKLDDSLFAWNSSDDSVSARAYEAVSRNLRRIIGEYHRSNFHKQLD